MYTSPYIMTTPIVMPFLRGVVPVLRMSRVRRSLGGAFGDLGWWTFRAIRACRPSGCHDRYYQSAGGGD